MPIDPNTIKPGDTVRVRFQSREMVKDGIAPAEITGVAYRSGSILFVAAHVLNDPRQVTILEHIPARPDWADALVVRDKDGDLWMKGGHRRPDEQLWTCQNDHNTILATADLNDWEPITVVLDADGNPPQPEPEWLDAGALDELDDHSVALPRDRDMPRYRFEGRWYTSTPDAHGLKAEQIAPARLLWAPDA